MSNWYTQFYSSIILVFTVQCGNKKVQELYIRHGERVIPNFSPMVGHMIKIQKYG